jgi:hypothetical protein
MPYVLCNVTDGLRPSEVTVEVQGTDGRPEFLRVHRDFVKTIDDRSCLPIGIVFHDRDENRYLIELPHEADSGANRLWVNADSMVEPRSPRSAMAAT